MRTQTREEVFIRPNSMSSIHTIKTVDTETGISVNPTRNRSSRLFINSGISLSVNSSPNGSLRTMSSMETIDSETAFSENIIL